MSDLLAFQFAIERGDPGSVMCAYNRINGAYACENDWLLNKVLKGDFGFTGYVMSDWGAVHSTVAAANNGLDQHSGYPFDDAPFFGKPLPTRLPPARCRPSGSTTWPGESCGRCSRTASSTTRWQSRSTRWRTPQCTRAAAEQAAVLLKNDRNLLPLRTDARRSCSSAPTRIAESCPAAVRRKSIPRG